MRATSELTAMDFENGSFLINSKKPWGSQILVPQASVERAFDFSREMTVGSGQHRDHRSGGSNHRNSVAIFHDAFNGKICEIATRMSIRSSVPQLTEISEIDFSTSALGSWDSGDLKIGSHTLHVKSTKHFGNLLLLEQADWSPEGNYAPGGSAKESVQAEAIVLARVKPELWKAVSSDLFENDQRRLRDQILEVKWYVNVVGFATKSDIRLAIAKKHLIKKNALLQKSTYMDADNYYIQAGDLWDIGYLGKYLASVERSSR